MAAENLNQLLKAFMHLIWTILIGFVAGLLARAILPGNQSMGFFFTAILGIAGSLIATYLGQFAGWYAAGAGAGCNRLWAVMSRLTLTRWPNKPRLINWGPGWQPPCARLKRRRLARW